MTMPTPVMEGGPRCEDDARRGNIQLHPTLNGIDFVEYRRDETTSPVRHLLEVHFLKSLPDPPNSGPDEAYELTTKPHLVGIHGGTRVVGIDVIAVTREAGTDFLTIQVTHAGDFSIYWLTLGWVLDSNGKWQHTIPNLDARFSIAPVNFRAGCPVDIDCRQVDECRPELVAEPLIDYLAKDYASFRRLLLDLIPQRNPGWLERNPADLGIALVELFAYTGDYLSYFQDAVANEAYLDTARQRVSAKRHARLVDYRMHDGRNAWAPIHFAVGTAGTIPQGARILTRITRPLAGGVVLPPIVISSEDVGFVPLVPGSGPVEEVVVHMDPAIASLRADPALHSVKVFELAHPARVDPLCNEIRIHTWGDLACCLPRGTTSAYLYSLEPGGGNALQAVRPPLAVGDFLLLEEVLNPVDGTPAAADRTHRTVVRLTDVEEASDPLYSATLTVAEDDLQVSQAASDKLPLLHVGWERAEALTFPLCISERTSHGAILANVAVARGNIALADHGLTVREVHRLPAPVEPDARFPMQLGAGPLTMQCQPGLTTYAYDATTGMHLTTERFVLDCPTSSAVPAVAVATSRHADGPNFDLWEVVPTLLDSGAFEPHLVADVGNDGVATLRFGDGEYGREVAGVMRFDVTYRIGNGTTGNVGAEALAHLVEHPTVTPWPLVTLVRNPLEARGGTEPESIEQVRQYAPAAFRAEQFRAVTAEDYATVARKVVGVQGAVAAFRWTGSWHTVFVGIDPTDDSDLLRDPGGHTRLSLLLEQRVRATLRRYALAGYDLEIRTAQYAPLEVEIEICVLPTHFRGDVVEAVRRALSPGISPDGSPGFFDSSRFTFGQPVYLSQIYAAVERVPGVDSAEVKFFKRYGRPEAGERDSGILDIGAWEIARLDNDPSAIENGVLRLIGRGGK